MLIKPLPAGHGDCILISFPDVEGLTRNIMIDTGPQKTYGKKGALNKELLRIRNNNEFIDLLVITHIDDDHIAGAIKMFADVKFDINLVKKVWFNSGELITAHFDDEIKEDREIKLLQPGLVPLSVRQGVSLENILKASGLMPSNVIFDGHSEELCGAKITVLSPQEAGLKELHQKWEYEKPDLQLLGPGHNDFSKPISELVKRKFEEDTSVPNGSSLALLIEVDGKKGLFLGDAHSSSVEAGLRRLGYSEENRLEVNIVKLSHHGSRKNTSPELLELIKSEKYILCTDGSRHGLPDKESMARVIHNNLPEGTQLFFNYKNRITQNIFSQADSEMYLFDSCFVAPDVGIQI